MPSVMPIFGTRPEAIKMAPIVSAFQESAEFDCIVTVTGQHREMLDQVNELFGIEPDHDLNILQPRQSLSAIMTRTIDGLDKLFAEKKPDAVIVQGDTTTSTAGAIAAFAFERDVAFLDTNMRRVVSRLAFGAEPAADGAAEEPAVPAAEDAAEEPAAEEPATEQPAAADAPSGQ